MSTQHNDSGTLSSVIPGGAARNDAGQTVVLAVDGVETIIVPGGSFLLLADFVRQGGDLLLVGPDGTQVLIQGYFDLAEPPALVTEGGAMIAPDLAARLAGPLAPGQYAAAGDAIEDQPIGRVDETIGEATATRVDGTTVSLQKDSPVFQGDIIETEGDGAIAIVFIDETTFSLGEDARMVLDELIFDPASQEGSSSFSVIQGVFVFVSGEIAENNPDAMLVKTPVATLGIRGTKVAGYAAQEGEENKIALLSEGDGEVGELLVYNPSGQVVLSEVNETTIVSSVFMAPQDTYISSDEEIFDLANQASRVLPEELRIGDPDAERDGEGGREGRDAEQGAAEEGEESEEGEEGELAEEEGEVTEEELAALYEVEPAAGGEEGGEAYEGDLGDISAEDLGVFATYDGDGDLTFGDDVIVDYSGGGTGVGGDDDRAVEYVYTGGGAGGGGGGGSGPVYTNIVGTSGDDIFSFSAGDGNFNIDGDTATDTVVISGDTALPTTFSISSNLGTVSLTAGGSSFNISNVEELDIVGGSGDDTITVGNLDGTTITNNSITFSGGAGNDTLNGAYASKRLVASGGEGDDTLITGSADDVLDGGGGNDTLSGGAGNDILGGGAGADTVQFTNAASGVVVDMVGGTASDGEGGSDLLYSIESAVGSNYDDSFIMGGGTGGSLDGGGGYDTLTVSGNATGDNAFLVAESAGHVLVTTSGFTTFTLDVVGTENLIIDAGGGNDSVTIGDLSATEIDADGVTLLGGDGNDVLLGSVGNEVLDGGANNDLLDGGDGFDTVAFSGATSGVNVSLASNAVFADGQGGTDNIYNIETVVGTDYVDQIVGDANANTLFGGAGGDTLFGNSGDDILRGGAGDDILYDSSGSATPSKAVTATTFLAPKAAPIY